MLHKCPNAGCSKTFFFKRNMTCSNCDGSKRSQRLHTASTSSTRHTSNGLSPEALYAQQNAMQLNQTLMALESSDSSKECKSSDDSHIRRNQCEDTPTRIEPSYTHSHSHSGHDYSGGSSSSSSSDSWSSSSYSSDSGSSYDSSSSSSSDSSW
ncbi:hypothetical protein GUK59_16100 [Acinetobacter baumannii]|nr:hypothetical protein [Acinetobacter baumannii]